jgi:hypothetical protein
MPSQIYDRGQLSPTSRASCLPTALAALCSILFLSAFLNSSTVLKFLIMPSARHTPSGGLLLSQ